VSVVDLFRRRHRAHPSNVGFLAGRLTIFAKEDRTGICMDQHQLNPAGMVVQARVRLDGDVNTYRLILAPSDVAVAVEGRPADAYFPEPLEVARDRP
jgi:hypothetical protein